MKKTLPALLTTEVIQGVEMVKVPKFYTTGTSTAIFSPVPLEGFQLYPAFRDSNNQPLDCFYVTAHCLNQKGKFEGDPKVTSYPDDFEQTCLNTGEGFTPLGYWEWCALFYLFMLDVGSELNPLNSAWSNGGGDSDWRGLYNWRTYACFPAKSLSASVSYRLINRRQGNKMVSVQNYQWHTQIPSSESNPPGYTNSDSTNQDNIGWPYLWGTVSSLGSFPSVTLRASSGNSSSIPAPHIQQTSGISLSAFALGAIGLKPSLAGTLRAMYKE